MKAWYLEISCPVGGAEQDQSPQLIWPVPAPETLVPSAVDLAYKPVMAMAKMRNFCRHSGLRSFRAMWVDLTLPLLSRGCRSLLSFVTLVEVHSSEWVRGRQLSLVTVTRAAPS